MPSVIVRTLHHDAIENFPCTYERPFYKILEVARVVVIDKSSESVDCFRKSNPVLEIDFDRVKRVAGRWARLW